MKKLLLLIVACLLVIKNSDAQKRFHVAVLGNPNLFLFLPTNNATTGISLLPELEFSYDINKNYNTRFFLSVLSTDVSSLISSNSSGNLTNTPFNSRSVAGTNLIGIGGFAFRLSKPERDQDDGITVPILNSFSVALGYGNAFIGKNDLGEDIYKEGMIFMLGFKIRIISFNIGKS